jgi:hypothetical protein
MIKDARERVEEKAPQKGDHARCAESRPYLLFDHELAKASN